MSDIAFASKHWPQLVQRTTFPTSETSMYATFIALDLERLRLEPSNRAARSGLKEHLHKFDAAMSRFGR